MGGTELFVSFHFGTKNKENFQKISHFNISRQFKLMSLIFADMEANIDVTH